MIKTWNQRCEEHPNHQSGMVSHGMIQARMQEEIDALRAALSQPEPAAPTVVEPVAWIFMPNNELLWPAEVEATNPIEIDSYRPLFTNPPRTALTVDQAIYALSSALAESKGWLRDYSDAVIRDAIDRREARTALREAARQALIALEIDAYGEPPRHERNGAINALRDALAGKAVTP
jgi:hypothetical protein